MADGKRAGGAAAKPALPKPAASATTAAAPQGPGDLDEVLSKTIGARQVIPASA